MIPSLIVFVIVYILLATEKVEKSMAAILGAGAVLFMGLISFEEAVQCVDLNVVFLLIGMMTCVGVLAETGFFEWVAMYIAQKARGNAIVIMILLLLTTMVFSALLDNVTTIILLAPITILIAQILELPPLPFIILEAVASNIGGTATLIGDPPNIIIGSQAELSFNDFIFHLAPCILVAGGVFLLTIVLIFGKRLKVSEKVRQRVLDACPELAIRDARKMRRSLFTFGLIFIGFMLHHHLHLPAGIIALSGMAIMLILCKSETDHVLKAVEWDAILFFIGLFIMIGALEHNGAIDWLATQMLTVCGDSPLLACMVILWGGAFLSGILDNIPFVMAMMPLVQKMVVAGGGTIHGPHPLYWALALGACLGGNGTIIGASANIVAAKIGQKNGYPITFGNFFKFGFPFMIQSLIIASLYLWLRYFVWT